MLTVTHRLCLLAALLVTLWGVTGLVQMHVVGFATGGYRLNPWARVIGVDARGPAARAGLRTDDRIVSIDGVPARDLPWRGFRRRPRIGEVQELTVRRGEDTRTIAVRWEPYPREMREARLRAGILAIAFAGAGVWGLFSVAAPVATVFSLFGSTTAFAIVEGPRLESAFGPMAWLQNFAPVPAVLLLLHLVLSFQPRSRLLQRPRGWWLVYGAVLPLALLSGLDLIFYPRLHGVVSVVALSAVVVPVGLCLGRLVVMLRQAEARARWHTPAALVVYGASIAFVPLALEPLFSWVPDLRALGAGLRFVAPVAIPAFMATAIRRDAGRTCAS